MKSQRNIARQFFDRPEVSTCRAPPDYRYSNPGAVGLPLLVKSFISLIHLSTETNCHFGRIITPYKELSDGLAL